MKQAFLSMCVQCLLKPACTLVVKNVRDASSSLSCTIVMEEGCYKSKRLSYTAEFKREVIWRTEEKGNRKAPVILGVYESNI
jgi:hypothetical protein